MEVHRTRLVGKDFSKTYDLTKTYHESDYRSLEGVSNTLPHTGDNRELQENARWYLT